MRWGNMSLSDLLKRKKPITERSMKEQILDVQCCKCKMHIGYAVMECPDDTEKIETVHRITSYEYRTSISMVCDECMEKENNGTKNNQSGQ